MTKCQIARFAAGIAAAAVVDVTLFWWRFWHIPGHRMSLNPPFANKEHTHV